MSRGSGCPAEAHTSRPVSRFRQQTHTDRKCELSFPESESRMTASVRAGECSVFFHDCSYTLVNDARSAAGMPCPETSHATRTSSPRSATYNTSKNTPPTPMTGS